MQAQTCKNVKLIKKVSVGGYTCNAIRPEVFFMKLHLIEKWNQDTPFHEKRCFQIPPSYKNDITREFLLQFYTVLNFLICSKYKDFLITQIQSFKYYWQKSTFGCRSSTRCVIWNFIRRVKVGTLLKVQKSAFHFIWVRVVPLQYGLKIHKNYKNHLTHLRSEKKFFLKNLCCLSCQISHYFTKFRFPNVCKEIHCRS